MTPGVTGSLRFILEGRSNQQCLFRSNRLKFAKLGRQNNVLRDLIFVLHFNKGKHFPLVDTL